VKFGAGPAAPGGTSSKRRRGGRPAGVGCPVFQLPFTQAAAGGPAVRRGDSWPAPAGTGRRGLAPVLRKGQTSVRLRRPKLTSVPFHAVSGLNPDRPRPRSPTRPRGLTVFQPGGQRTAGWSSAGAGRRGLAARAPKRTDLRETPPAQTDLGPFPCGIRPERGQTSSAKADSATRSDRFPARRPAASCFRPPIPASRRRARAAVQPDAGCPCFTPTIPAASGIERRPGSAEGAPGLSG
jgi:hypothetical protein